MKKTVLLSTLIAFSSVLFAADPPAKDISSILSLNSSLSLGLDLPGEQGVKGCVADFNDDGVDDFIVTGLYNVDASTVKGFFRVYLGQKTGVPSLAYSHMIAGKDDFLIVGNGAIDCTKLADGSFLVAVQGGAGGNWSNPFKGNVYSLKVTGNTVQFESVAELDAGAGRGSILFLDMNNDGLADIFQGGWNAVDAWVNLANFYINDGSNEWFDQEFYEGGSEPVRPAANNFVVKGDLDNDGKIDLLQPVQGLGLLAYFNKGDGDFQEVLVTPFSSGDRVDGINFRNEDDATQADLIDFNGDGLLDIVLIGTNDATPTWQYLLKLYKNNGDKTFTEINPTDKSGNAVTFLGGQRADIAIADFDGDGKKDIILGAENQNAAATWGCRTYFLSGNGQGGFDQSEITFDATSNPNGIVPMSRRGNFGRFLVGDFNGDGKKDLVTAGSDYYAKNAGLRIYFNVSQGGGSGINDAVVENISVYTGGNTVFVNGAVGQVAEVYSAFGALIQTEQITSDQASFSVNGLGVYIVKIGSYAQKIVIK